MAQNPPTISCLFLCHRNLNDVDKLPEIIEIEGFEHLNENLTLLDGYLTKIDYVVGITNAFMN
jgi:hypothetical protein